MNRSLTSIRTKRHLACLVLLLATQTADAYVGPGAGLSLLGALWALIVAVAAAIAFIFAWPIRRMRRRKREEREALERAADEQREGTAPTASDTAARPPPAARPPEPTEPRRP